MPSSSIPEARATYSVVPPPYHGPSADEILAKRRSHLSAGQYHFYSKPLMLVDGKMQYCFDEKGKKYLDCYSNVCQVGHCHPHFVARTTKAITEIISNTRYLHPNIVQYAEKLKSKLPPKLNVCYFVNSGSEANDLALRMSRIHTGKKGVICLNHAYHGVTASCSGISTSLSVGTTEGTKDFGYNSRDVHIAPVPDPYRGKYRGSDATIGAKYAEEVSKLVGKSDNNIAAFIHESVQGVGGQIFYPKEYLQRAYAAVRAQGGVCIADEVQTGFGRCGEHYWAFEMQKVEPDIVVMGKPIGNGFPIGAVVTTREIASSFDGAKYFNTNGGNPVSCAAGLAVMEITEQDKLQQNAAKMGQLLLHGLQNLKRKHPIIGDVRGRGLFIGIELVRSRTTLEPATSETKQVMEKLRDVGILVGIGGILNNVIRIKGPLNFNAEDCAYLIAMLDEVLTHLGVRHPKSKM